MASFDQRKLDWLTVLLQRVAISRLKYRPSTTYSLP